MVKPKAFPEQRLQVLDYTTLAGMAKGIYLRRATRGDVVAPGRPSSLRSPR